MRIQPINATSYHAASNSKIKKNGCKKNNAAIHSNELAFKGKKAEFLLDVALAGAFSAATGFMGAGLGTAYLFHKYVLKNNNNNDDGD